MFRKAVCAVLLWSACLGAASARASIVSPNDASHLYSSATSGSNHQQDVQEPNTSGGWNGITSVFVQDEGHTGFSHSVAQVNSTYNENCVTAIGYAAGTTLGAGSTWSGQSVFTLYFRVERVQRYTATFTFDAPPDMVPHQRFIRVENPGGGDVYFEHTAVGTLDLLGRLAPGEYLLKAFAWVTDPQTSGSTSGYDLQMCFEDVTQSHIAEQPLDQNVPPGVSVDLTLTPSTSLADVVTTTNWTYQWRRNLVPLVDGGRLSGVHTAHLVIANVAYADSGRYDCVVSDGVEEEPSRQAKLTVVGGVGVEPRALLASGLELSAPSPNPFRGRTELRFRLARAARVDVGVYDLFGRRVKVLRAGEQLSPGEHGVTWDGTDDSGGHVPSGVYFVRAAGGGQTATRRAVLVTTGR